MIDSWGKLQSGLLMGNFYELGNFDECMNSDGGFAAQYCLAQFSITLPEGSDEEFLKKTRTQIMRSTNFEHFQGVNRMIPSIDTK